MKRNAFFSAEQMVAALTSAPDTAVQDASNPGTHAADWDNAIVSHSLPLRGLPGTRIVQSPLGQLLQ